MVTYEKASDIDSSKLHIGMLLYGEPGAGKTHAACMAPGALVLLTETNGLTTIRRANPGAIIAQVNSYKDLREVIAQAVAGKLPEGTKTLVVDSLTEVQRLLADDIMAGRAPGTQFSLQDWGTLTDRMRRFMRTLRDIPYQVVATALSEAVVSEADGVRYVRPAFQGKKTPSEVAQYFNAVAYVFKRQVTADDGTTHVVHQAMFDGPSRYTTKPCHPVTGTVEPDVAGWYKLFTEKAPVAQGDSNE